MTPRVHKTANTVALSVADSELVCMNRGEEEGLIWIMDMGFWTSVNWPRQMMAVHLDHVHALYVTSGVML